MAAKRVLVLDKSVVKAAPKGFLKRLRPRFNFLLTDALLQEIGTEKLDKREMLCESEKERLDQKIRANFKRTIEEAGNLWIDNETALTCEIETGCSAKQSSRFSLCSIPSLDLLSEGQTKKACLDYDTKVANLVSVVHAPEDESGFQKVTNMGEEELFMSIQTDYSSEDVLQRIAQDAKDGFGEVATSRGLHVSPHFKPRRDWFSFGITLASWSFLPWKFWKRGDRSADPKKPPNPYYDMIYRGYIAVADGILSADKDLLKLSWACWSEKRANIFDFNRQEQRIVQFEPQWKS
ncbi:MAG: hypothetical protein KAV00_13295 [Phycisphaerae bacterium]|nr:hypothetical protein [Phycisphaerae bacterium]